MKIAIDAMGGDIGPHVTVAGAVDAAREYGFSIILVGQKDLLASELAKYNTSKLDVMIKDASQVVSMDDLPKIAVRKKKDSSMRVAAEMVVGGEADAMVSAGNTGAVMAIATIFFKPLKGVDRPAIATILPNSQGVTLLLDVGANVDCKPRHLLEFAIMGHAYVQQVLHIPNPSVGLLSIGSEESKGNELTRLTLRLLKQTPFNFIGNVEGRDIFKGKVDVVITDGFVGNVALKVAESVGEMVTDLLRMELERSFMAKVGFFLMTRAFKNLKKKIDYAEYGGAPLLGLNKVCIICHGISDSIAIKNAVRVAAEFITKKVNLQISEDILAVKKLLDTNKIILGGTY